jgi:hypothetical protein
MFSGVLNFVGISIGAIDLESKKALVKQAHNRVHVIEWE